MLAVRNHLVEEVSDGALIRTMFTGPFGPYSESWFRKVFLQTEASLDVQKLKRKMADHYGKKSPTIQSRLSDLDVEGSHDLAFLPDFNVEFIEGMGEGVAPLAAYFSRDLSRPFEIDTFECSQPHLERILEAFPFCYWLQANTADFKCKDTNTEGLIDAALSWFACLFIDAEIKMSLDEAMERILLPGLHIEYNANYGVVNYVEHKVGLLKSSSEFSLEKLYEHWASWPDAPDKDSIRQLIKRWRAGSSIPSPSRFADFVYLFGGTSLRRFFAEWEVVGLFHVPQLIQRYRQSVGGGTELLESDTFYRERVHFWYDTLTEHYSEVLATRAKEIAAEGSGPG